MEDPSVVSRGAGAPTRRHGTSGSLAVKGGELTTHTASYSELLPKELTTFTGSLSVHNDTELSAILRIGEQQYQPEFPNPSAKLLFHVLDRQ